MENQNLKCEKRVGTGTNIYGCECSTNLDRSTFQMRTGSAMYKMLSAP